MAKKSNGSDIITVSETPGDLAPGQTQGQAIAFAQTEENIELLKSSLTAAGTKLTDSELGIFLYQAQKTGLDPLARQIYVMKRDGGGVSFMTSIDGQRLVAQRTGEYNGQTPPQWCGKEGVWKEVWLEDGDPAASRIGVYRKGMAEPVYGVATWKSYNQGRGTWKKMGDVMLAKCAEALALRKAFPQELSGLYTPEEMNSNDTDTPEPPRVITTQDALAQAGKALVDKGFTRNEALQIMAGIADVDDPSKLNGNNLAPVMEIVAREDADNLRLYLPGDDDEDGSDDTPLANDPPEAEIVTEPSSKTVTQALEDGDLEPPASFLAPETEDEKKKVWAVPNSWELGGGKKLPRPEMKKLYSEMMTAYSGGDVEIMNAICQQAIGKDKPALADDFITMCLALAERLNAAEQGTLV